MDNGRDCTFFHHPMGREAVKAIRLDFRKTFTPTEKHLKTGAVSHK